MGMLVFLFALMTVDGLLEKTLPAVNILLANFALLFVPANVSIVQHTQRLTEEWLPITASIVGSSLPAMATTVLVVTRQVARLLNVRA